MSSSVGMMTFPTEWKNKCSKSPTRTWLENIAFLHLLLEMVGTWKTRDFHQHKDGSKLHVALFQGTNYAWTKVEMKKNSCAVLMGLSLVTGPNFSHHTCLVAGFPSHV